MFVNVSRALKISLLLLVTTLCGCGAIPTVYNNATTLAMFQIDGYFDLDNAQTDKTKTQVRDAFAWHRQTQLPLYASKAREWAAKANRAWSTDEIAAEQAQGMAHLRDLINKITPAQAELALSFTEENLKYFEKTLNKDRTKYKKDWLDLSAEDAQEKRFDEGLKNLERIFGSFNTAQKKQLRSASDARSMNLAWNAEEKLKRQQFLQATLRKILVEKPSTAQAQTLLIAVVTRFEGFSSPEREAWSKAQRSQNHAWIALATQIATTEQRQTAKERLLTYAAEFEGLSTQR